MLPHPATTYHIEDILEMVASDTIGGNMTKRTEGPWVACNYHDELVAALKMLIRFIPDGWPMPLGYSQVVAQVETALAKAEGVKG